MNKPCRKQPIFWALSLIACLAAPQAFADKPSWAGGGRDDRQGNRYEDERRDDDRRGRDDRRDDDRRGRDERRDSGGLSVDIHFGDRHREAIHDYYGGEFRAGNCPPGLAKKHNGCMPPGQAKQWRRNAPLPRDVNVYDLPRDLSVRLGVPPAGYRYVRVASDILMISIGTGMVVDAIEDLGGR